MMTPFDAYTWLKDHSVDTSYLISCAELAAWDQRTYIPPNGHTHRSKQMEALARFIHQRSTTEKIDECLNILENSTFLDLATPIERANVTMWRREYEKQKKIPQKLASALARFASEGESAWEVAMKKDDWNSFLPHLEKNIQLNKEKAEALGYNNEPYDALLDEYEIGADTQFIESLFHELKTPLVELFQKIAGSSVLPNQSILHGQFELASQKSVCAQLVNAIGYDFKSGRIDETMHPFSVGIGPGDSRITTRYNSSFIGSGIFGCLHEAGHSLYELGLPSVHYGTPAGMFVSLGMHESQSRLWENMVGRSKEFWMFAKPILDQYFSSIKNASLSDFLLAINAVDAGLIRVEADEVTYNLHVMLRFELELALFRREISAIDLPALWAEKMKAYLGILPHSEKDGVMQDVHWSAGMFGYFPTYTLGNIYAAQLFHRASSDIHNIRTKFSAGDFSDLLAWLRINIHQLGQTATPKDIIHKATGELPHSKYFITYLQKKYASLYKL